MKRVFLLIYLLLAGANVFAQEIYRIDDFLENHTLYYTIKKASNKNKVDNEAYILYNKNKKVVLEQDNTPLKKYLLSNLTKATLVEYKDLPEPNIRFIQDFNFDGIPDIAIYRTEIFTTLSSGCSNPSEMVSIYLSMGRQFLFSSSLSYMHNAGSCYQNISFSFNKKTKTVKKITQWGHCYDVEAYEVEGTEFKFLGEYTEGLEANPNSIFIEVGGRIPKSDGWEEVELNDIKLEEDDENILLSFDTKNKKGEIILFQRDDVLYYAFRSAEYNNYISFAYPLYFNKAQESKFNFENNNGEEYTLEFNSGAVKYIIYESADSLGIKIYVNGKLSDWKADLSSKKGSLKQLVDKQLQNLTK